MWLFLPRVARGARLGRGVPRVAPVRSFVSGGSDDKPPDGDGKGAKRAPGNELVVAPREVLPERLRIGENAFKPAQLLAVPIVRRPVFPGFMAPITIYDEALVEALVAVKKTPRPYVGLFMVNDPAATTYEALQIRDAAARVTMIDPNIRLGFIAGKEGPYRARIERMIARADIVKLSDEDLHWLSGSGDVAQLARAILAQGPKLVFITEGAAGARAVTATQNRFVAAQKVTVADTVGAGDTFNAGALCALHEAGALTKARLSALTDAELDAALTLGTRSAAITVSRAGANPPWRSEL